MSGSETLIEIAGTSAAEDPVEALREALAGVLQGLLKAGLGPHLLKTMRWQVAEPARFHLARRDVELAYREVFAGFRVPVELERAAGPGLRAVATAGCAAVPPPDTPVYQGYSPAALARQYSPRLQADMGEVFRQWSRDGARFSADQGAIELAYGPSPDETFDLVLPAGVARPPVWILIHGGYWQASDKAQHVQFAAGMLQAGFAVVVPNYGLAPETPLGTMVDQLRRMIAFLVQQAANLSVDAARLHLAGHSAGAHLAAMVAATDTTPTLRSALLLSGIFDLAPLSFLPVGRLLKLQPRSIATLSPLLLPAPAELRIGLAVGEGESDEFKRQSRALAKTWQAPEPLIVPGHHFSMLDGLNGGALLALARSLAEG